MATNSNVDIIRGAYDALAQGDVPAILARCDPAIEWTEAEGFPYAGTYIGPDAVLNGVIMRLGSEWTPFQVTPTEFIDGGDQVVALGRYAGTYNETGKSFDAAFAHVWTLRDGKVVRFRQYVDSALVQEALQP
jgi:ketosteroid isomerase-like protein